MAVSRVENPFLLAMFSEWLDFFCQAIADPFPLVGVSENLTLLCTEIMGKVKRVEFGGKGRVHDI
jgi:hypothetical protein